jgi:hypothetical protein
MKCVNENQNRVKTVGDTAICLMKTNIWTITLNKATAEVMWKYLLNTAHYYNLFSIDSIQTCICQYILQLCKTSKKCFTNRKFRFFDFSYLWNEPKIWMLIIYDTLLLDCPSSCYKLICRFFDKLGCTQLCGNLFLWVFTNACIFC